MKKIFDLLSVSTDDESPAAGNNRSHAVMERLNMVNTNKDFNHATIPLGSPLRPHVLYELAKERWNER